MKTKCDVCGFEMEFDAQQDSLQCGKTLIVCPICKNPLVKCDCKIVVETIMLNATNPDDWNKKKDDTKVGLAALFG